MKLEVLLSYRRTWRRDEKENLNFPVIALLRSVWLFSTWYLRACLACSRGEKFRKAERKVSKLSARNFHVSHPPQRKTEKKTRRTETSDSPNAAQPTSLSLSGQNWIIQLFNSVVTVQKFIIITNSELIMLNMTDWRMAMCKKTRKKILKNIFRVCSFKIQTNPEEKKLKSILWSNRYFSIFFSAKLTPRIFAIYIICWNSKTTIMSWSETVTKKKKLYLFNQRIYIQTSSQRVNKNQNSNLLEQLETLLCVFVNIHSTSRSDIADQREIFSNQSKLFARSHIWETIEAEGHDEIKITCRHHNRTNKVWQQ